MRIQIVEMEYSISSNESEEDNTYLSYNKVIGTSLDRELYQAFEILDYTQPESTVQPYLFNWDGIRRRRI